MTDSKQQEIINNMALLSDWTERYQYLIDLGKNLPSLPPAYQQAQYLLSGCQSRVWIVPKGNAEKLTFLANSDSAIVSGLIALLLRVYSGQSAQHILQTEPYFIESIGLKSHLSLTRSNGLMAMLHQIKTCAQLTTTGIAFE